MLTDDDCKYYARWWHKVCLDEDWSWKQMAALAPHLATDINSDMIRDRPKTESAIINEMNNGDISRVVLHAQMALTEDERAEDADENNADFRRLCSYMLRGALEATRKAKAEEVGDFTYEVRDPLFKEEPSSVVAPISVPATQVPQGVASGPTLASLVERFVAEKANMAKVSAKTQADYRASLDLFGQLVGPDQPVETITGSDVVEFKNLLILCPTNFRKRLRTNSLREAVRLNSVREGGPLDTLYPKTINEKYLSNVKTFFDWAKINKYVSESPALRVRAEQPKDKEAVDERDPFTLDDLCRIFASNTFLQASGNKHGYRFWPALIALFTGCRLNEIGQLRADDIVLLHGIPHFAVRDADDDQRLKSIAARRWIPVHHELVALGFLDFVKQREGGRLFPDWQKSGDGYYSSSYSKWFSRLLKVVDVKTDKKSFHSFRHTFADALDEVVEASIRDKFLGHSSDKVRDRYGSKQPKLAWSEAFLRLSYPGLDLSHLRPQGS